MIFFSITQFRFSVWILLKTDQLAIGHKAEEASLRFIAQSLLFCFWGGPVSGEIVSKALKYKLRELFVVEWRKLLEKSSKCDIYSMFKINFEPEKYLSVLPQTLAVNLCRFRTSNHKLEIETMRYVRPFINRLERKCLKCTLNETGNEYHHVLVCPYFADIRLKYISNRYTRNVSFVKFLDLISSKSGKIMLNLAIYVTESMKLYR